MEYEQLKLENQICFPIYAASRLIIREYQPFLVKLGITYPQYLVLMLLWEKNGQLVNDIAKKLLLNTNTITPLIKRLEKMSLLEKKRSSNDVRKIHVFLTHKGEELKAKCAAIPRALAESVSDKQINVEEIIRMKDTLNKLIEQLK